MTQEAQRVALAAFEFNIKGGTNSYIDLESKGNDFVLPNYLSDLNAIARIEAKLEYFNRTSYTTELRRIVLRDHSNEMINPDSGLIYDLFFYSATAPHRAEALLRTYNLWEDQPCQPT